MKRILVDTCVVVAAMDGNSPDHKTANHLLEWAEVNGVKLSMPAHAFFEIWCVSKRLEKIDKTFQGKPINNKFKYPIEFIYINKEFLSKYGNIELEYARAGDFIFLIVAKVDNCPIITLDNGMRNVAVKEGIRVFSPEEYIESVTPP